MAKIAKEQNLQFKVSAALKNIIGKDLITDKYIAVFELVKNSFDAHAKKAELFFENDKMVIKDDGKGMNFSDIKNKWLFVAYSAKADNTEDNDYRQKINKKKTFAGAKGIGRFACDRLGKKLRIISVKKEKGSKIESLEVFWESFEKNSKDNFIDIKIKHRTLETNPYPDIKHGTILEISDLREEWTNEDVKRLNKHLSKLINPMQAQNRDKFGIIINFNGKRELVESSVFNKLKLKTTQILVEISNDGKYLTTELIDRGEKIYKIKEKNYWSKTLSDIKVQLFYLNAPSKIMFHHLTGVRVVEFGSVFLYKNDFRVFPFGEEGDDSLGIDRRKQQGYARNLGTRDLVGFIAINGKEDQFRETSSRDGGLIETKAYKDLKEFLYKKVLRRLENYVVEALSWTYVKETHTEISPKIKKKEITDLIKRLTQTNDFIDIDYGYGIQKKIKDRIKESFSGALDQLILEAKQSKDEGLLSTVRKIKKKQQEQKQELREVKKQKNVAEGRASALIKVTKQEFKNLVSYHHQIGISALTADEYLSKIFKRVKTKDYSRIEEYLQKIKREINKINSIARFASGSGMKENATKKDRSLTDFINNYIENDYKNVASGDSIISIDNKCKGFQLSFRPFDISIILDNLISNSKKAKAKQVDIKVSCNKNSLTLVVEDDGNGLDKKFKDNPAQIFDAKTSTTDGAGWGLFHVKETVDSLGGDIKVQPRNKGLKFIIVFKKN